MNGLSGLNGKRILKATIIDPLSDDPKGIAHYKGELEETIMEIADKYDVPLKKKLRSIDEAIEQDF